MLGRASSLAPSFDIPTIPMGDTIGIESLANLELAVRDAEIEMLDSGWAIAAASVEAVEATE